MVHQNDAGKGDAEDQSQDVVDLSARLDRATEALAQSIEAASREAKRADELAQLCTQLRHDADAGKRAKEAFLANMSVELRTPLNAIIGFSELMIQRPVGFDPDKSQEYLKDIQTSGMFLLDILNCILDIAQNKGAAEVILEATVDLREVIDDCCAIARKSGQEKNVDLAVELPDWPAICRANAHAMKQVLLNLISNGIKFTGAGGQVKIGVERVDENPGRIFVRDTGIGMTEDRQERALLPFEKSASDTGGESQDVGLGHAIVKSLVDGMTSVTLAMKSAPGVGTEVLLYFLIENRANQRQSAT